VGCLVHKSGKNAGGVGCVPGGKPLNKYEDVVSLLPWLLPAGLPISAVLLLAGLVGLLFWQRQQRAA
jgi:hypothetical protein